MSSTSRTRSPGAMVKPRRNSRRVVPSGVLHFLGEDAADAELPGRLEREDHAAGRWAGDEVHHRRAVRVAVAGRPEAAQLARGGRILQDEELLQVALGVLAALEQEVAFLERARTAEELLGPGGDRPAAASWPPVESSSCGPPVDGCRVEITAGTRRPWPTAPRPASGSAVPMSGRYESKPRRRHSARSSSPSRTGSSGSAKMAVPTWTATAPQARKSSTSSRLVTPPMATIGIETTCATS